LPHRKLSEEQEIMVADAFVAGEKMADIVRRLDLTRKVVRNALKRRGVYVLRRERPHKFTEDERRQMVDLYLNKEITRGDIAKRMGVSVGAVENNLIKAGITLKNKGLRSRTLNLPADPALVGYIAGIVDGEGNILSRLRLGRRLQVVVAVTSTDKSLVDWLMRIGGRFQRDITRSSTNHFGKKEVLRWIVSRRRDVKLLIEAILPYLIIKRADAIKALKGLDDLGD